MTKKIFRSIITVAMVALFASLVIATTFLYEYYNKNQVNQLKDELMRVAVDVENDGADYFKNFDSSTFRFTLIEKDGTVVYDTAIDSANLENHLDREEVKEALKKGSGSSSRFSKTLTQHTLYQSVVLQNGQILRISVSQLSVLAIFIGMSPAIAAIFVFTIIVSFVLADRMAKRITEPLNKLDLENPTENNAYEELLPILDKINKQHKQIASQIASAQLERQEFTANVSHELKTPLQSIIGSAELLENGLVKEQDRQRFVGHIKNEATRLVSLINDIIRLSQLDEGKELINETVDLYEVAKEVIEVLSDSAAKKDVKLRLCGRTHTINGVRRYIYEIIYNLCDNAIRYNVESGSVKIEITSQDNNTVISVSDTGIGIAPEHQPRIFERFYRVDKSHSRQTGGTGLGLSIVKHAVQYHGGKTELESELGKGTTVKVIF